MERIIVEGTLGEAPLTVEQSAAEYDAAIKAALSALRAAYARSGVPLLAGEVSRVARRFELDGIQVAEIEVRAEAESLLAAANPVRELLATAATSNSSAEVRSDLDLLALFRKDIGKVQLLKHAEEIELGDSVIAGLRSELSLTEPDLSDAQISRLEASVAKGRAARDEFWRCNAPLALKVALRFQGMGLDYLDLVQYGLIGLMRAIDKWDPHRGYRFTTYAYWWIEQQIRRALADEGRTIRLPVHVVDSILRIRKVRKQLFAYLGREPNLQELSDSLGIERTKLALYLDLEAEPLSLDLLVGEAHETAIGEFIAGSNKDDHPEDRILADERTRLLNDHLSSLSKRQQTVLGLRFGLGEEQRPKTLQEIGDDMGITRERVRQIEAKAIRLLAARMAGKVDRELFVS